MPRALRIRNTFASRAANVRFPAYRSFSGRVPIISLFFRFPSSNMKIEGILPPYKIKLKEFFFINLEIVIHAFQGVRNRCILLTFGL